MKHPTVGSDRKRCGATLCVLVFAALAASNAVADVVYLKDGGKLEGDVSDMGGHIILKSGSMKTRIEKDRILRIEVKKTPREEYQERLKAIPPEDAEAHYMLGTWCEENGLRDEARKRFERVVELEPNHAKARKKLGYRLAEGQWVKTCAQCNGTGVIREKCPDCVRGKVICDKCEGRGFFVCKACGGKGKFVCPACKGHPIIKSKRGVKILCATCKGTGSIDCGACVKGRCDCPACIGGRMRCPTCGGKGYRDVPCPSCTGGPSASSRPPTPPEASSPKGPPPQKGTMRKALSTGARGFVEVRDSPLLNPDQSLTLEAWVKPSRQKVPCPRVISKLSSVSPGSQAARTGYELGLLRGGTGAGVAWFHLMGTTRQIHVRGGNLQVGKWHHLIGAWDGKQARLYVDGALIGTAKFTDLVPPSTSPLRLGNSYGSDIYIGLIDDVRIYSKAYTPDELKAGQGNNDMLGYWQFEGDARDVSGHGHHGALRGTAEFVTEPMPRTGPPH